MPFKSKAQERYLFAKEPALARRWLAEYGQPKSLPEHKRKVKRPVRGAGGSR